MTTTKLIPTLAAAFLLAASARAAAPKKTPELLEKGKADYGKYCAAKALKPKPRNFVTEPLKSGDKASGVFDTLATGVKGTAMVPFKHLPEEDRWALSYYVLSLKGGAKK